SAARWRTGGVSSLTSDALERERELALYFVYHLVRLRESVRPRCHRAAFRRGLAHLREVVARVALTGARQDVLDQERAAAHEAVRRERIAQTLTLLRRREVIVHGDACHRARGFVREHVQHHLGGI